MPEEKPKPVTQPLKGPSGAFKWYEEMKAKENAGLKAKQAETKALAEKLEAQQKEYEARKVKPNQPDELTGGTPVEAVNISKISKANALLNKVKNKTPLTPAETQLYNAFVAKMEQKAIEAENAYAAPKLSKSSSALTIFEQELPELEYKLPGEYTLGKAFGLETFGKGLTTLLGGPSIEETQAAGTAKFNLEKDIFNKTAREKLNNINIDQYVQEGKSKELFELADYFDDPLKEADKRYYENPLKLQAKKTADLLRAYGKQAIIRGLTKGIVPSEQAIYASKLGLDKKTPQEILNDPKALNGLGKLILSTVPGPFYSENAIKISEATERVGRTGGFTGFEYGGFDVAANASADRTALEALKITTQEDLEEKLREFYRAKKYNRSALPKDKVPIDYYQERLNAAGTEYSNISTFDIDNHIKKNYPKTFAAEQQQKADQAAYAEAGLFTKGLMSLKNTGRNIWNNNVIPRAGMLTGMLTDTDEVPDELNAEYWSSLLNTAKFDKVGYTIGLDEDGNPVSSNQFYWIDQDGKEHWNNSAFLETGTTVAVDFLELMAGTGLVAKAAGALANLGKTTAAVTGINALLEGVQATKFGRATSSLLTSKTLSGAAQTFTSTFLLNYPRIFSEQYENFKDVKDAKAIAALYTAVEAASESIIPNTPDVIEGGARRFLPRVFGAPLEKIYAEGINDTVRGLAPGISNRLARKLLLLDTRFAKRTTGIIVDVFQEGFIEEEAALVGGALIDKIAQSKDKNFEAQNELTLKNFKDTAIESIAGMALTFPFMGRGTRVAENKSKILSRFEVANNPELFRSLIASKFEAGKITQEEAGAQLAKVNQMAKQLEELPAKMSSIRDMKTLLEDEDAQIAYFEAAVKKSELLNYVPTPEERDQYEAELESIDKTLYKTEELARKYNNLSIGEKRDIITKSYKARTKNLFEHEDLNPVQYEQLITATKKDLKKNPGMFSGPITEHIAELEANREKVKINFFNFLVNNNKGLTFEQIDYKMNLLALNSTLYDENAVEGIEMELKKALIRTAGPVFGIKDENEFIDALAKNYVTADKNQKPLVSNGKPLLFEIRQQYINGGLFANFLEGLTPEEKQAKIDELSKKFFERVIELKKDLKDDQTFPGVDTVTDTKAKAEAEADAVADNLSPIVDSFFEKFTQELNDIDNTASAEEAPAKKVEAKANFVSNLLTVIRDSVRTEEELFSSMKRFFEKISPENAEELLEEFKNNYTNQTLSRKLSRVFGKGFPKNFLAQVKVNLEARAKGEPVEQLAQTKKQTTKKKGVALPQKVEDRIKVINEQIQALLAAETIEKERLAFLETLLEEAKAALQEQTKAAEKAYKEFLKITAPKKSKRAENLEKRRQELEKELRAYFDQVQSIADRIREIETNLNYLERTRKDLENKSNYYKELLKSGEPTTADIFERVSYLDSKVRTLNKLIDKAKNFIDKLKGRLSYIAQVLTGQRGFLEEGKYASKEQIADLKNSIDFADATEAQLDAKEKELTNLIKAAQDAERQIEYLLQLFETDLPSDLDILELKETDIKVPEELQVKEEEAPVEVKDEATTTFGATKQQLKVKDKLIGNPDILYVVTLTDKTTVEGTQFKMLGNDSIEGVDREGKPVVLKINTLKSARKAGTIPVVEDPTVDQPFVETSEEEVIIDFEQKDARQQFPQSGFITSSDEFDVNDQEVEDDYSQAINQILKATPPMEAARISSMRTYLEALMGPDIITKIYDILNSEASEEEKLQSLTDLFTDSGKLIFYQKTLAWWVNKGSEQFAKDLVAPAFYIVDSKGKIQRFTTKGPNPKGYPIHRNLPLAVARGQKTILLDYQAIKVSIKDPIIQRAILAMDLIRDEIKKDPSLIYTTSEVFISPGAIKAIDEKQPFKFVPVGDSDLLVVGTDISETSVDHKKGTIVSEYEGEFQRVSFPKLTKEQIEVIKFIVKGENLPSEFTTLSSRLKFLNTLIYTNPFSKSNRVGFKVENNKIVAFYNDKVLTLNELEKELKNSYLNFYHDLYSKYTPYTVYEVKNGQLESIETTSYRDFINEKAKFFIPQAQRINKKFYFGQPIPLEEKTRQDSKIDEGEPYTKNEDEVGPVVTEDLVDSDEEFVPMDFQTVDEKVEELKELKENDVEFPEEELTFDDFDEDDFKGLFRSRGLPKNQSEQKAKEALAWMMSSKVSELVDIRRLFHIVNSRAYAVFTKGMITLYEGSDYTDLYHEAWHVFSQYFLTKDQKIKLYETVKKKKGSISYKNAEEYLAEGYRDFALEYEDKKPKNYIETIYKKIRNFIDRVFNHPDFEINKMFEALYTGNINQYAPSENNFMFQELFTERPTALNLTAPDGTKVQFSDRDLNELLSNLDATLVYQALDNLTTKYNRTIRLGTVLANRKNKKFMGAVYSTLKDILRTNLEVLKNENKPERVPLIQRYEAILNSWSKVVKTHATQSPIFVNKVGSAYDGVLDEVQNSEDATRDFAYDKSIEEFSSISRAKPEVIALIASIGKVKKGKLLRTELLGLPVLDNFTRNWKTLSSALAGITDYGHMLYKIEQLLPDNPQFQFLLDSLPRYKQKGVSKGELSLMSSFMNTFSEPIVDMFKVRINIEEVTYGGKTRRVEKRVLANIYKAQSRASTNLLKGWGLEFKNGTDFTKTKNGQEYLLISKVLDSLTKIKKTTNIEEKTRKALELAQNTGLFFEDNILDFLPSLAEKNKFIESIVEYVNEILVVDKNNPDAGINDPINQVRAKVAKSLNYLSELAIKAEDEFFADEASNPEGNYIYKKNQFHYMSKVATLVNQPALRVKSEYKGKDTSNLPLSQTHEEYYPSFGELMDMYPELSYLDFTKDNFSYGSSWLRLLYDINGNRILTKKNTPETLLRVAHFGGTEYEQKNRLDGKKTTNLVAVDKLLTDIQGFLLKGIQENIRFGDKSSAYTIYVERPLDEVYGQEVASVGMKTNDQAIVPFTDDSWKKSMTSYIDHAVAEVLAINQARNLAKQELYYKNYVNNGKKLRFLVSMVDEETRDELEGDQLHAELDAFETIQEKIDHILATLESFEVADQIAEFLENEANQLKNYITDELSLSPTEVALYFRNLLPNTNNFNKFDADQLLLAYTFYDTLHRIEQFKFFYRDPAFFKNAEDIFKRLSKYSATGKYSITDPETLNILNSDPTYRKQLQEASTGKAQPYTNKFRAAVIKDELVDSVYKDEYVELVMKRYNIDEDKAKQILAGYGTTGKGGDRADGQGIANLDFYRFVKLTMGEWYPEHEEAYNKEVQIYKLYKDYVAALNQPEAAERIAREINNIIESQTFVFEPQKPQYAGTVDSTLPVTSFHKFSIYPATPSLGLTPTYNSQGQLIIEESDMFSMVENMYRDNVDYLIMASGVKDSAVMDEKGFQSFYTPDGNVNKAPLQVNEIYASFFKEQVQLDPHLGIHSIIFPTQFRGLLFLDEVEKGKFFDERSKAEFQLYKRVVNELISVEREKLKRLLGATKNDFSDVSIEMLGNFLTRELESKDVGSDTFNFLITKDREFVFNYNGSTERRTIASILEGVVYNRIIKQKLSGTHYVQGANLGNTPYTKATAADKKLYQDSSMKFYSKDYQYCDVKVAFSERYKPLLNIVWKGQRVGTLAKLNSLLRDEEFFKAHGKKVTMVGCRVPVQGLNSMDRMRIVQFLPPSAGSLIILPEEIVVKTGADFDIDKMFIFEPNIDSDGNYYEYTPGREEVQLRNKAAAVTKEYENKKRKLAFVLRGLGKKITDEELKELFNERKNQLLKNLDRLERNLLAEDIVIEKGESITQAEIESIDKETTQVAQDLLKPETKIFNKLDKLFNEITVRYQELQDLNSQIKRIKLGRANKLVDIISERLSNPDILTDLIIPNDNPDLLAEKDGKPLPEFFNEKTNYLKGLKSSLTSVVTAVMSNQVFKTFLVGKGTLGVAAKMNKTHQISAQMDMYDNQGDYLLNTNNGKSLSSLFDTKGRRISSIFSQYINGLVDIAKEAWVAFLGVDRIKGPIQMYSVKRGTPVEEAIAFTLQPKIHEYTKQLARNKSIFINVLGLETDKRTVREKVFSKKDKEYLETRGLWATRKRGDEVIFDSRKTLRNILDVLSTFNPNVSSVNVYSNKDNKFKNLTNFADAPFIEVIDGKKTSFRSPEHYVQAMKALFAGDKKAYKAILEEPTARGAQLTGNKIQVNPEEWKKVYFENLEVGMRASFANNPSKVNLLLETKDAEITYKADVDEPASVTQSFMANTLMKIRKEYSRDMYNPFNEDVLIKELTAPSTHNQLLYFAQYIALETKSSDWVAFQQRYSPDTTKETSLIENIINEEAKTKMVIDESLFSGLDTFKNTIIEVFSGLVGFSKNLQINTNDLFQNNEVLTALLNVVEDVKDNLSPQDFDFKKVSSRALNSIMQYVMHNYYKTNSGENFFDAYQINVQNASPLSSTAPKEVQFAKRLKSVIDRGKKLDSKIDLKKEYPAVKFLKPYRNGNANLYTFIFTAGTNLTPAQIDEFQSDFVALLNFNHPDIEYAAEVRNLFSELLEVMYVASGFQYFEGNINKLIPSQVYRAKATAAIKEFLSDKSLNLEKFENVFLHYNYPVVFNDNVGSVVSLDEKTINVYREDKIEVPNASEEIAKGEEHFIMALSQLDNYSVYLQLIQKTCD